MSVIFMPFEKNKAMQEPVWKYQFVFLLYPARLHHPVIVCQMKKGNGCPCDTLNCSNLERREEKRGCMNAGQMPFHLLHTVTCRLRCFRRLPVSVVRMPDVCQGLTQHG